jgi:hypothetical protein
MSEKLEDKPIIVGSGEIEVSITSISPNQNNETEPMTSIAQQSEKPMLEQLKAACVVITFSSL